MPKAAEQSPPYLLPAEAGVERQERQVRLFRNGANQAVRIPKEFELPGVDAVMRREGGRLIIEAVKPKFEKGSPAALLAALDAMAALGDGIDEEFPDVDAGMLPLDDIILDLD
jgi:antitoxin VapB